MVAAADDPLAPFHPIVRGWFERRFGVPTDVQRQAWPAIARGEHLLATAPTGSGKTLAAFLWALDRLLAGSWEGGRVRVLYVSPLKALNNDVERNLLAPLSELTAAWTATGAVPAPARVAVRSGDTPPADRRRMLRRPPEVLITTPESLNLLITTTAGREMLGAVATVILDEVHAVAGTKRGTHLITAVDRLVRLAGEFQRVALSATVKPLPRIARFVGGWVRHGHGETAGYRPRPVTVLEAASAKVYEMTVELPAPLPLDGGMPQEPSGTIGGSGGSRSEIAAGAARPRDAPLPHPVTSVPGFAGPQRSEDFWRPFVAALRERIRANRTTLIFTNSRRMAEKLTRFLNEGQPADIAYAHHGSLSKEIRLAVERRFKEGRLPALVATSSLELGIDIGDLDEVLLVQSPFSVASTVQRVGRAGHAVGAVSRGRFYPLFGRDLLRSAVTSAAALARDIEPLSPIGAPLDVLTQVVLSMVAAEEREADDLYDELRTSDPYHELPRRHLDLVLEMLAGRYADSRVRELVPRIAIDRLSGRIKARPGAARWLYTAGGTIPDRGYFHLRLQGSLARLGELDEEFVWERGIGDRFVLGAQTWRIAQITHNDVLVTPAGGDAAMAPFWKGEDNDGSFHLAQRVGELLAWADTWLGEHSAATLPVALAERCPLASAAAEDLTRYLEGQRAATGPALPHRRRLLVERVRDPQAADPRPRVVLHTMWGGQVNRPLAMALAAAWEERFGTRLQVTHDDDALALELPHELPGDDLLSLVESERLLPLLRLRLESSGFFGARFRENAGRALLLPRGDQRHRVPLWLNRQRSKRLLDAVRGFPDFPLLLETWRTCLQDEMDLATLRDLLGEVERGEIEVVEVTTSKPSPFAANLGWKQTNKLMYEDDTPEGGASRLGDDLLAEVTLSAALRPRVPPAAAEELRRKLQRTWPGYAPAPDEVADWVRERLALPLGEWRELLDAVVRDASLAEADVVAALEPSLPRLVAIALPDEGGGGDEEDAAAAATAKPAIAEERWLVTAVELLPRLVAVLGLDDASVALAPLLDLATPLDRAAARDLLALARRASPAVHDDEPEAALGELLAEWLRFYGPLERAALAAIWRLEPERLVPVLDELVDAERVVVGELVTGVDVVQVCDAENLGRLLRMVRAAARPQLPPQPLLRLPLFLAVQQGLAPRRDGIDGLQSALERLFGWAAPAALLETDLLPARLEPYHPAWLDTLLQETDLLWLGVGKERLTFAFPEDVPLLRPEGWTVDAAALEEERGAGEVESEEAGEASEDGGGAGSDGSANSAPVPTTGALFPGPGRFTLPELLPSTGGDTGALTARLWGAAWAGAVTNDTFAAVRKGVLSRFRPATAGTTQPAPGLTGGRLGYRRGFGRWQASRAFTGRWYPLAGPDPDSYADPLDREERQKERARLLLQRYGVVFRELLPRELPALQWRQVFRSLRLMELSGEVAAGAFFEGVPGPQFASPAAVRRLRRELPENAVWWVSALDPAAPCGLALEGLRGLFPRRAAGSHLVFQGSTLVLTSEGRGKRLRFLVPPDHPRIDDYLEVFRVQLTRAFAPWRSIEVQEINGEAAAASPFASVLAARFQVSSTAAGLRLWRRY
jgi:ATP-dependent helicase Lhr and Lhr-like helicase